MKGEKGILADRNSQRRAGWAHAGGVWGWGCPVVADETGKAEWVWMKEGLDC